jgi:hypothetical protein
MKDKLSIKDLSLLVTDAVNGIDNFKEGAVGSNGYGFVFKDPNTSIPYVTRWGASGVFGVGAFRNFDKNFQKHMNKIRPVDSIFELADYDELYDLLYVGSVNTLVPTLQFGGDEMLFKVWMFVKTPDGRQFPATFYWGASGMHIGGWKSDLVDFNTREKAFPKEFEDIVNFSPFHFSTNEKELFLDALEFALKKVPISDFWGVFNHDLGNVLMAVRNSEPFIKELGRFEEDSEAEKKVEPLLDMILTDVRGEEFTIKLLPGINKIYAIEYIKEKDDVYSISFTTARQVLFRLEDDESMRQQMGIFN